MKANVGGIDRVLRIVAGLALLSMVFVLPEPNRWWGLVGIVPLATALLRFCPLYALIGVNTCPAKNAGG
ncbi:MAG: DUF2892 domain-containing protein [Steroidobacteraceae bacterium]